MVTSHGNRTSVMSLPVPGSLMTSSEDHYTMSFKGGTVNLDICTCIHFRGLMKMDNFVRIKIRIVQLAL